MPTYDPVLSDFLVAEEYCPPLVERLANLQIGLLGQRLAEVDAADLSPGMGRHGTDGDGRVLHSYFLPVWAKAGRRPRWWTAVQHVSQSLARGA